MDRSLPARVAFVLLRVVAGWMFFQAGAVILLGWFGGMPDAPSPPPFPSQTWIGGFLELVGGLAVLLGLATRPVAFVLSGMMAVTYWQFHAPNGAWPVQNGGVSAVLYCFLFLYLAARGGGDWSLDARIRRSKDRP